MAAVRRFPKSRTSRSITIRFPSCIVWRFCPSSISRLNRRSNQDDVALAYFTELQQIPGFEVMPPGVVKQWLVANRVEIDGSTDFQQLARRLGVDAVIRGAVTEFSPYYPPRMGLAVDWFAANPSFHPIPPGYGLPWGTTAGGVHSGCARV